MWSVVRHQHSRRQVHRLALGLVVATGLVVLVLTVLGGNSLARHVALPGHGAAQSAGSLPLPAVSVDGQGAPVLAATTSPLEHPGGPAHEGQHLLHLLGACAAVLAAALLVPVLARAGSRAPAGGEAVRAGLGSVRAAVALNAFCIRATGWSAVCRT